MILNNLFEIVLKGELKKINYFVFFNDKSCPPQIREFYLNIIRAFVANTLAENKIRIINLPGGKMPESIQESVQNHARDIFNFALPDKWRRRWGEYP